MHLVLIGPPGAGKGTQGERLAQSLGLPKIATGDLIRLEIAKDTPRGRRCAVINEGHLAPAADVRSLMVEAMQAATAGAIYDGAVRTVAQAEGLDALLAEVGHAVTAVLVFEVPMTELVRRAALRTVCANCQSSFSGLAAGAGCTRCGGSLVRRAEDEPAAQVHRFRTYEETTLPALDVYRRHGVPMLVIDGLGDIDEVTARVERALVAMLTATPTHAA